MKRRSFLQAAAAGTAGIVLGRTAFSSGGGCQSDCHPGSVPRGRPQPPARQGRFRAGLEVTVRGEARRRRPGDGQRLAGPARRPATVCRRGRPAGPGDRTCRGRRGNRGRAPGGPRPGRLGPLQSFPRYRFSIDDNSFFLRDIAQKGYKSLFDCFYLKMLRDLHAKYGVKFVLNIYYTTDDDFNLPQFPDRYKGEWRDNADWLRLAFHAYANKPDRPYQDAPPEKLTGRPRPGGRRDPPLRRRGDLRAAHRDPLGHDPPEPAASSRWPSGACAC